MCYKFCRGSIIALFFSTLLACGGGGGGGGGNRQTTGEFNLGVTDAAVDSASMVLVQFTGVAVKPAEGPPVELPLSGDSQTCQELLDSIAPAPTPAGETTVRCIDLKSLDGAKTASLLQGVELEAGNYNWIRLDVDADRGVMDSIIVLDEGGEESLFVPSGSQSGLKLNSGFTILAGGTHDFLIDFDLRKSVNNPRGFPDYRLKPSLRLIDLAQSGGISGTVEASRLGAAECPDEASDGTGVAIYVYQGADAIIGEEGSANPPLTSAGVALNGDTGQWEYTVGFLAAPADYRVAFTCQAASDSPETPDDGIVITESTESPASVAVDQVTSVNFY